MDSSWIMCHCYVGDVCSTSPMSCQIGRLADGLKKLNLKYCKARWMMTAPGVVGQGFCCTFHGGEKIHNTHHVSTQYCLQRLFFVVLRFGSEKLYNYLSGV